MSVRSWPLRTLFRVMAASIFIAAVIAGSGSWALGGRAADARNASHTRIDAQSLISEIQVLTGRIQLNQLVQAYVPGQGAIAAKGITTDLKAIQARSAQLGSLPLTGPERTRLSAMRAAFLAFSDWVRNVQPPQTAAEADAVSAEYAKYAGAIATATQQSQDVVTANLDRQEVRLADAMRMSLILVLVICAFTALIISTLVLRVGRQITERLAGLGDSLKAMAGGDLTRRVPVEGPAELAGIATCVNDVVDQFTDAFTSLGATSGRLGVAAAALENLAEDVGRKAEETSSQAEVVARTADDVSQNVQAVAAGGVQMGASISEISRNANEAARVAVDAVQAVESTTGTMSKLSDSSREIGDVVRLITSIAEQTNLLALNATIEAARAGSAGKGFAVVADEVKQLAQETARATEDISARVETIQQDADQAARAILDISGVITRINEFQTTIASAVEEQTATTEAINAGVGVAATGSGQIASSIAGVADAAAATASSMGDAHDNARELSRMSEQLASLVAGFRLR